MAKLSGLEETMSDSGWTRDYDTEEMHASEIYERDEEIRTLRAPFGSDWTLQIVHEGHAKKVVSFEKTVGEKPTYKIGEGFTAEQALQAITDHLFRDKP